MRAFIRAAATSKAIGRRAPHRAAPPCTLVKVPKWEQTSPHGLLSRKRSSLGKVVHHPIHDISYLTVLTVLGLQVPGLSRAVHRSRLHNPVLCSQNCCTTFKLDYRFLIPIHSHFHLQAPPCRVTSTQRVNSPFPYRSRHGAFFIDGCSLFYMISSLFFPLLSSSKLGTLRIRNQNLLSLKTWPWWWWLSQTPSSNNL